jgi:hypothetical protein
MPPGAPAAFAQRCTLALQILRNGCFMSFTSVWHPTALRLNWPGAAVAVVVALAATYVPANFGGPQLLYALFFGLTFHFLSKDATCQPGIEFCSKTLLRTGVALLGAKIKFSQITALGVIPIATAVCALVMTMLFGWRWSPGTVDPVQDPQRSDPGQYAAAGTFFSDRLCLVDDRQ